MNFRRLVQLSVITAALVLCASTMKAQDQQQPPTNDSQSEPSQPVQPLPPEENQNNNRRAEPAAPARGLFVGGGGGSAAIEPDTRMLSGAETLGLGSPTIGSVLFDFGLHATGAADTGVVAGNTDSMTTLGGNLNYDRTWRRYRLTMLYDVGETLYHPDSFFNTSYQDLRLSQDIKWNRWSLHVRDDFTMSPQSTFSGFDLGLFGQGVSTAAAGTIVPTIAPNTQTILTGRAMRISNIVLGEADYSLTRRAGFTVTGSYGWLHFIDPGYLNSTYMTGQAGHNYLLSAKNSLAFTYSFNQTDFSGTPARTRSHVFQVNLGRKITGRWAFQVGIGPQLLLLENFQPPVRRRWSWSALTALTYERLRTGFSFDYSHAITGGSGVVLGAETDTLSGSVHRRLSRAWNASAGGGYARNRNLISSGLFSDRFSSWFGTAGLDRELSRHFHLGFNYGYQKQDVNGICPVLACGKGRTRHTGGVTVDWHFRPSGG